MIRLGAVALGSIAVCALVGHLRANPGGFAPLPLVVSGLVACPSPRHHDGDAIRCEGQRGKSMRLYAIDAPEMPGVCRPGRRCVPGDPFASRDHLASLTAGRRVTYRVLGHDRYGRSVVQVFADGVDVSCQMVRGGYAIERYGRLRCDQRQ